MAEFTTIVIPENTHRTYSIGHGREHGQGFENVLFDVDRRGAGVAINTWRGAYLRNVGVKGANSKGRDQNAQHTQFAGGAGFMRCRGTTIIEDCYFGDGVIAGVAAPFCTVGVDFGDDEEAELIVKNTNIGGWSETAFHASAYAEQGNDGHLSIENSYLHNNNIAHVRAVGNAEIKRSVIANHNAVRPVNTTAGDTRIINSRGLHARGTRHTNTSLVLVDDCDIAVTNSNTCPPDWEQIPTEEESVQSHSSCAASAANAENSPIVITNSRVSGSLSGDTRLTNVSGSPEIAPPAGVPLSAEAAASGDPELDRVYMVADLDADNTGENDITPRLSQHIANGRTFVFEEGTYLVGDYTFSNLHGVTLRAQEGSAVTLVRNGRPEDRGEVWQHWGQNTSNIRLSGFTFDFDASVGRGGGRTELFGMNWEVSNIDIEGRTREGVSAFRFDVRGEGANGTVRNVTATNGSTSGTDGVGMLVGAQHEGHISVRDCHLANFAFYGILASSPATAGGGTITVRDSRFENNNISNIQIGSSGSLVENCNIRMTDIPRSDAEGRTRATGITLAGASNLSVDHCEVVISESGGGRGAIRSEGGLSNHSITNTFLQCHDDTQPAVIDTAAGNATDLNIATVSITGDTTSPAMRIRDRGVTIDTCCIQTQGDGIVATNSAGSVLNTTINVPGTPIDDDESLNVEGLSLSGNCPRPTEFVPGEHDVDPIERDPDALQYPAEILEDFRYGLEHYRGDVSTFSLSEQEAIAGEFALRIPGNVGGTQTIGIGHDEGFQHYPRRGEPFMFQIKRQPSPGSNDNNSGMAFAIQDTGTHVVEDAYLIHFTDETMRIAVRQDGSITRERSVPIDIQDDVWYTVLVQWEAED